MQSGEQETGLGGISNLSTPQPPQPPDSVYNSAAAATSSTTAQNNENENNTNNTSTMNNQLTPKIKVPKRVCQGGFDEKFETDPYNVNLHGLMTATEYTDALTMLNERLKPARTKSVDTALLAASVLVVPLVVVWGARHGHLKKKHKRLLHEAILEFHEHHPHLYMRWNRRPVSQMTIERRREDVHGVAPGGTSTKTTVGTMVPSNGSGYFEYQLN